jgi:hypothetical protein
LPVKIADHAGKARKEKYVLLNPLAVDCLELDRCAPRWSVWNIDETEAIAAQVIDPARTGGAEVFRCVHDLEPIIITRELAAKLAIGSAVRIGHLKR